MSPELTLTLFVLLLPVAALSGWWVAQQQQAQPKASADLKQDYFRGLNYLVNDQADQALEVFIRMMQVDDETVETHFTLASLFRRRGEVDRALRIHQNLIARPKLSRATRQQATLELVKDYTSAGLLDRAEDLLSELITQNAYRQEATERLIQIYEQQKDWAQAIVLAKRVSSPKGSITHATIAHYYCEQAEVSISNGDERASKAFWEKALSVDSDCIRAGLNWAELSLRNGDYRTCLQYIHRALQSNIAFTPSALPMLMECYLQKGDQKSLIVELEGLANRYEGVAPVVVLLHLALNAKDQARVSEIVEGFVSRSPSLAGIGCLLSELTEDTGLEGPLSDALAVSLKQTFGFACKNCGYSAHVQHWHCPGCQTWGTVTPQMHLAVAIPEKLDSKQWQLNENSADAGLVH